MTAEEAFRALCAGWEHLDADAVAVLFAPDGRYEGPLFAEIPVGPEAIRAACADGIAELSEVRVPIRALATTGDTVLAEGSFLSQTVEGSRLDFDLVMVLELRDGLVVRFKEYFDTAQLA